MTRVGIPRQRSTEDHTRRHGDSRVHAPHAHSQGLTCAGDASKHPALAVLDGPGPGLAPLLEDGHAAAPAAGRDAADVGLAPAPGQDAPVVIGVDLETGSPRDGSAQVVLMMRVSPWP